MLVGKLFDELLIFVAVLSTKLMVEMSENEFFSFIKELMKKVHGVRSAGDGED